MKILIVEPGPGFSVADVCRGWRNALAEYADVQTYNLADRIATYSSFKIDGKTLTHEDIQQLSITPLLAALYFWWPDVIFIVSAFFISDPIWDVLKLRPHKVILCFTESPYEDDKQLATVAKAEPFAVLLNDPTNIEQFRELCPNTYYAPHAYDPHVHTPGPTIPDLECDFGFVGTGYRSRVETFARIDWRGIDLKLAGMWEQSAGTCLEPYVIHAIDECYPNDKAVDLYRSAKLSANVYRASWCKDLEAETTDLADGWAMTPREVEMAACGLFFFRQPRGENEEVLSMLPAFEDPADLSEQIRWWLAHDSEREDAALQARKAIHDRTFDAHAKALMHALGA